MEKAEEILNTYFSEDDGLGRVLVDTKSLLKKSDLTKEHCVVLTYLHSVLHLELLNREPKTTLVRAF